MNRNKFFFVLPILLIFSLTIAFSDESKIIDNNISNIDLATIENSESQEDYKPDFRNYLLSFLITQADNIALSFYNTTILGKSYAIIDTNVMWHNITHPWVWDQDEYNINQIGHPYQGSMYHQGARSNGLNYYESLAVTAFGSLTLASVLEAVA